MKNRLMAGFICAVLLMSTVFIPSLAENLKYGAQGNQVAQAQTRLARLGFYTGAADGKFGYSTFLAVKAFQSKNALTVDGVIGEATVLKLYRTGAINQAGAADASVWSLRVSYGATGPAVSLVQEWLRGLGYYAGPVEARFGYSTFLAVKDFQQHNALTSDGVVGPLSWVRLQDPAAVPKPVVPVPSVTPDPSATPTPIPPLRLAYGDIGAQVLQAQTALADLGYYAGTLDGKFGYSTFQAVREFQRVNTLKADGVIGALTWAKLFDPAALPKPTAAPTASVLRVQYGNEGDLVVQIQTRLTVLGYYELAIDGKFGYSTYLAVRAFQGKNALKADGIVGQLTWDKMMDAGAIPN